VNVSEIMGIPNIPAILIGNTGKNMKKHIKFFGALYFGKRRRYMYICI
jgi:hypothetical protein